jgi:hypothetical protein
MSAKDQMKTLDHWKSRFTTIPSTIECSEMRILTGRDHEPPAFVGPGQMAIAKGKNEQGLPNFEADRITRFYEEIMRASQGSRWVLCMTLASVAEGLARALMTPEGQISSFDKLGWFIAIRSDRTDPLGVMIHFEITACSRFANTIRLII